MQASEAGSGVALNYGRPMSVTLANGERLVGTATTLGEGKLVVNSPRFGSVTVDWADVAQVSGREPTMLTEADMAKIFGGSTATGSGSGSTVTGESTTTAAVESTTTGLPTQPLGQEPEEADSRLLFLRQSSVLLRPGQFDVEIGLSYRRDEKQSFIAELNEDNTFVANDELRREFESRVSVRLGLMDRVEAFASLPLLYASEEEVRQGGTKSDNDEFGIGDTVFGLKAMLLREKEGRPEVILNLTGLAPTGDDPYSGGENVVALGDGHWGVGAGLTLIKSYDPVILFAGLDYLYRFSRNAFNTRIEPGHQIGYNFGMGFAVNEAVTLSAQLQGNFRSKTEVGGVELEDSELEPISIRFGLTYSLAAGRYLDSFVSFGVSDDAASSVFGASVTQRF